MQTFHNSQTLGKEESLGVHDRLMEDVHFSLIWKILLIHTRTEIYL